MNVLVVLIPVTGVVFGGTALLRRAIARRLERQGHRPSPLPPDVDPGHRFVPDRSVTHWAHTGGAGLSFGGVPPLWDRPGGRLRGPSDRRVDEPGHPVRLHGRALRRRRVRDYGRTAVLAARHGQGWLVADTPVGPPADQPEVSS